MNVKVWCGTLLFKQQFRRATAENGWEVGESDGIMEINCPDNEESMDIIMKIIENTMKIEL
jgi:hypothetical protein